MGTLAYLNLNGTDALEITPSNVDNLKTFAFKKDGDLCFAYQGKCTYYREADYLKAKEAERIAALPKYFATREHGAIGEGWDRIEFHGHWVVRDVEFNYVDKDKYRHDLLDRYEGLVVFNRPTKAQLARKAAWTDYPTKDTR
jgi:hypothetical protein